MLGVNMIGSAGGALLGLPSPGPSLAYLILAAIGVAVSCIDLLQHRIPNQLLLAAVLVLLLITGADALRSGDPAAVLRGLVGGLLYAAAFWAYWLSNPNGIGGGDVKLAWVAGFLLAWHGIDRLAVALLATWLAAVLAVAVVAAAVSGASDKSPVSPVGTPMVSGAPTKKSAVGGTVLMPLGPWMVWGTAAGVLLW